MRRADARSLAQVLVLFVPRPDRRQRHQMRERRGAHRRASHVRPEVAGERAEPGLLGVQRLVPHDEPVLLNHLPDRLDLAPREVDVPIPHHDRRRQIPVAHDVVADLLERAVHVPCLTGRSVVDQRRLLLGDGLLE